MIKIIFGIILLCISAGNSFPVEKNQTSTNQYRNISQEIHFQSRNLYNPFASFHFESLKIYFAGTIFVILFVFVKYASEKTFNYCELVCFTGCDNKTVPKIIPQKKCTKHQIKPGSILPESAFLVSSGAVIAIILLKLGINWEGSLDPNLIFNLLLVPIVMGAAWSTDKITFYRNLGTILLFAIVGTILNAAILAPLFYYGSKSRWGIFDTIDFDVVDSGLFATIICAVDPVAVLSVFESMHIDKLVYNVVFGESLLNDGVAVVFYRAFYEMKTISEINFIQSLSIVVLYFMYAFVISVILAFVMAIVISYVSKIFYNQQALEFVAVFSLNYLTYIIADFIKGSGIISLFFCVLIQRQYVQANLSVTSNTIISQVISQLSLLSEGVIYIMMGLTSFSPTGLLKNSDIRFSIFLIVSCYISRFIVVYFLGFIVNMFRNEKLEYKKALFIQAHGGLRGAIGFSLVLTLNEFFDNRYYYQSATAIMVFFSVYVLGASIKPLVKVLKISIETHGEQLVFLSLQEKISDRVKEGIKTVIGSSSLRFKWENWYRNFNNEYFKKWFMNNKTLERKAYNSGVLKVYRCQSILEAQEISNIDSTSSLFDEKKANSRSRNFHRAHRSHASFVSLLNQSHEQNDHQLFVSNDSVKDGKFFLFGDGKHNGNGK
uniref:Sodium/hydrogen exchanger n=1 Tax=Schmidtea mediterranea TaxID=79327 RepID=A0A0H3YF75_SCHMD|nr:slc9a-9 [Schmidtea mediterranea]